MNKLKAIETSYKGYRFRSRLEARWAVFFDVIGWLWEYEPEGFELEKGERYLPDFRCKHSHTNPRCFYVEVKPDGGDFSKALRFAEQGMVALLCAEGIPDATRNYKYSYCGHLELTPRLGHEWRGAHPAANAARSARFEFGENGIATPQEFEAIRCGV